MKDFLHHTRIIVYGRDWFEVTGVPRDNLPVCLAIPNPDNDYRIGCWNTPREQTLTACKQTWSERHVSARIDLVTCENCMKCSTIESLQKRLSK
jgi:hypothetical protein